MPYDPREAAEAWKRRGKGSSTKPFVDIARSGQPWIVDPINGTAHPISRDQYNRLDLPKYYDGELVDDSDDDDNDD
jgi:hypothetical protein